MTPSGKRLFWIAAAFGILLTESLFVVLLTIAFDLFGRAIRAARGRDALACGLLLGLAILCRPIALGLPLFSLLARNWKASRLVLLGSAIVVTPWVARNALAVGLWDVSSVGAVNLLYHRASAVEDARMGRPHETAATPADASDRAAVARMRRRGWDILRGNAGLFARLTLSAWLRTFGPDEDPLFQLLGIPADPSPWWLTRREASHQPRAPSLAENLVEGAFLLALLAGVILGLRAFRDPVCRPMLLAASAVVVYFLLVSGPEYYGRFRVPILPFLALIADAGTARNTLSAKIP
jgi:hypothetical protein